MCSPGYGAPLHVSTYLNRLDLYGEAWLWGPIACEYLVNRLDLYGEPWLWGPITCDYHASQTDWIFMGSPGYGAPFHVST